MRQETDNQERHRHQQHRPKGKLIINIEEEGEVANQRDRVCKELLDGSQYRVFHFLGIIHRTSHRVSAALLGEITQR